MSELGSASSENTSGSRENGWIKAHGDREESTLLDRDDNTGAGGADDDLKQSDTGDDLLRGTRGRDVLSDESD